MPAPSAEVFDRLRNLAAIKDVAARPTRTIDEVFTGKPLTTIPVGTAADVEAAFAEARAAQTDWAKRPVIERAAVIRRYRDLVIENREFLMDLLQAEAGKARWAAQEEIVDLIANANYYARVCVDLLKPRKAQPLLPGIGKTTVCYQPKGVVGVISPWNYPMTLTVSDSVPALVAGNAVVLKPDSQTPYCALACAELLYRAGLPRALYAIVPGPGSVVGTAITDNCDYLMFTGSSATGSRLAEHAGRRLIGFSAELGGKNPMIVARGANLDKVAKAATRACFSNAGQLCISIERIYVEKDIAEEFTRKFGDAVRNMKLGTAYDFSVDMGSLISEARGRVAVDHPLVIDHGRGCGMAGLGLVGIDVAAGIMDCGAGRGGERDSQQRDRDGQQHDDRLESIRPTHQRIAAEHPQYRPARQAQPKRDHGGSFTIAGCGDHRCELLVAPRVVRPWGWGRRSRMAGRRAYRVNRASNKRSFIVG